MKRILIVEDDIDKLNLIKGCIPIEYHLTKAMDFSGAQDALEIGLSTPYDIGLFDMSLPRFSTDPLGPLVTGGLDLLTEALEFGACRTGLLITQFEDFEPYGSLDEFGKSLTTRFESRFLGIISFRYANDVWKELLMELL